MNTYLYVCEVFGVKVNVTWTKLTNGRIGHASFNPFPVLTLKEMVSDPVLKITGLDIPYSLVRKRFAGGSISYKEDEDGEDQGEKNGEEEEEEVESYDDVVVVESRDEA